MPTELDVTETSSVSTTTTPDVTPPSSSGSDANPPSSSGQDANSASSTENQPGETREDLLSVIKNASDAYGKPEAEKAPATGDQATQSPQGDGAKQGQDPSGPKPQNATDPNDKRDPAEIPPDELAKFSPNAQARIRDLVKVNKDLKAQLEASTPATQGYEQLTGYMAQNNLRDDDVNLLLHVGSTLRRGDFKGFLAAVTPYVTAAQEALGVRIADDLHAQVKDGTLDENAAREMTRLRMERATLQANLQEQQARTQEVSAAQHVTGVRNVVANWEQQVAQTDPDFALKQDAVREFAKAIVAERGLPASPAQAVEYANEAYRRVNQTFGRLRPTPQPTRTSPSGVQAATAGTPEPRNLMEAMKIGLERARSGA